MLRLPLAAIFFGLSFVISSCGRHSDASIASFDDSQENQRFWPVSLPSDGQLNQGHKLMRYMRAATNRELPLNFFRDLVAADATVEVIEGDWPTYQPGVFYGGTISMPSAANPEAWTIGEWSSFYNELFHAWFGLVFSKDDRYASGRARIWTSERMNHYRKAYPSDPKLAQEEAWSETVASIMINLAPLRLGGATRYPAFETFVYSINRTVAPVSHSDRPGYTPEAESTYPAEWEYHDLFVYLTKVQPPEKNQSDSQFHCSLKSWRSDISFLFCQ